MKIVPLSIEFPQATLASIFPPPVSDYYLLNDLLTNEERDLRQKIRQFMEREVAPTITQYWEKAEFPFHVIPKLGALGFTGGSVKGYGCKKISTAANALAYAEIGRVDPSIASSVLVHSSLALLTIAQSGSEEQKNKYLPSLARLDIVSTYALKSQTMEATQALYKQERQRLKEVGLLMAKSDGRLIVHLLICFFSLHEIQKQTKLMDL